jgi:HK97 gp10 family phage protein
MSIAKHRAPPRGHSRMIRLEGANMANDVLQTIEMKARRRVVTAAVRAGCKEIVKEARARCPVDKGDLRRQIRTTSVKTNKVTGQVTGTVKPKQTKSHKKKGQARAGRYLHFVTAGTKPHDITPKRMIALKVGGQIVSRVEHPGARAQPFMDRAIKAAWVSATRAFDFKFDERMIKETMKARRGV